VGQRSYKNNAHRGEGRPNLSRDLAIDLGTANTLVYAKGRGIVLNEPTVIALDSRTNTVLNMGREAWQMIGRTPGYIVAVRPLRKGAITDFDITQRMIELLLKRAGISRFGRPRWLVSFAHADQRGRISEATGSDLPSRA
jgi:rod shape-determining protein MreB